MSSKWDWNKLIPANVFHDRSLKEFPSWEKNANTNEPYKVIFEITHGSGNSSRSIAIRWDDISNGEFYYRDITDSGLPFLETGERYKAVFVFQFKNDYEAFMKEFFGATLHS